MHNEVKNKIVVNISYIDSYVMHVEIEVFSVEFRVSCMVITILPHMQVVSRFNSKLKTIYMNLECVSILYMNLILNLDS